jgi:hypothetical protein
VTHQRLSSDGWRKLCRLRVAIAGKKRLRLDILSAVVSPGDRGQPMGDRMDNEPDARWLSYDEIADMRGIDRASAIRMVRRKHWPKRDSNDGTTRVAVPGTFFRAKRTKSSVPKHIVTGHVENAPGHISDNDNDNPSIISALSGHVTTLREQLALAQRTATEREEQLQHERDAERMERTIAQAEASALRAERMQLKRKLLRGRKRPNGLSWNGTQSGSVWRRRIDGLRQSVFASPK